MGSDPTGFWFKLMKYRAIDLIMIDIYGFDCSMIAIYTQ